MEKHFLKMIDQECPECLNGSGNIVSYMPIVDGKSILIDIECENCGYILEVEATIVNITKH